MLTQVTETETRQYYKRYVHHYHAVGITWALLTCCFLIINIIVFTEPQWIGDTDESPGAGWVGLYRICELINSGRIEICEGYFQDFSTILNGAFMASTFFVGVSILIIFLCILLFLLFLFIQEMYVYLICGSLQLVSTIFMFLGCVIYPHGWDNIMIRRICGDETDRYAIGQCQMRWAYILAIIGVFDILILAILAFVLALRQADKWKKYDQIKDNKSNPNVGYVVDVMSSKPGSVIATNQSVRNGSQPVFIVNDGARAPSEMSTNRKRSRTHGGGGGGGSESHLYHADSSGSVYRDQRDTRRGSF